MPQRRTPSSKPPRADGWLSPIGGFDPFGDPWELHLQSAFDAEPSVALRIFHQVIQHITKTLGDPRASAQFSASRPGVPRLIGVWEDHKSVARPSEWLREGAFHQLEDHPWFSLTARATRGGGAYKHTVWDLDLHDQRKFNDGYVLTLVVDLRYFEWPNGDAKTHLVDQFFDACSSDVETIYGHGRASLTPRESVHIRNRGGGPDLDSQIVKEPFRDLPRREYVPWVYPVNHLSPSHVKRLGGDDRVRSELDQAARRYHFEFPGTRWQPNGSLVLMLAPLADGWGGVTWITGDDVAGRAGWALDLFLRAGLVAFQNDRWLKEREQRITERRRSPEQVAADLAAESVASKAAEKRRTKLLNRLRTSPPRCAVACSVPAPTRSGKRGARGDLRTSFDLARPKHPAATTVYGRVSRDANILLPPIRLGSPTAQRAWFEFDPARDGFNGEMGHADPLRGPLKSLVCPKCSGRLFTCSIELSYSDESLDLPGLAERPQDFFDWFVLVTKCTSCSATRIAADWECA
jgi:hypothetical protein